MNKVLADILERPVPKGLTTSKVQELIKRVEEFDTNPKMVYSASGEKILKELDQYGAKDIPQNYRGVLLEHWLELLLQTQETITEAPRPTGPEATTLTSDQLTDLGESAEKRAQQKATIQAREKEAVSKFKETGEKRFKEQQKASAETLKSRVDEINKEQQRVQIEIATAEAVQEKFKDKVVYAKVIIPETVRLDDQEQKDLEMLREYARADGVIKTRLIDDLAAKIEEKIAPSLENISEEQKILIARTEAVKIVEALAKPEVVINENISTAILNTIHQDKKAVEVISKVLNKDDKLIVAAKSGAMLVALADRNQKVSTEILIENLFGPKLSVAIIGPKNIEVTLSEVKIEEPTTYQVNLYDLNKENISQLHHQESILNTIKEYGQKYGYDKISGVFTNYARTYLKEKIVAMPAGSIIKKAYSSPITQSILAKYGLANPVVWEAAGQSGQFVGFLMKVAPDTAGPILSFVSKFTGTEIVTPIISLGSGLGAASLAAQAATTTASVTFTGGVMAGEAFAGGVGVASQVAVKAGIGGAISTALAGLGSWAGPVGAAIGATVGIVVEKAISALKVWWTKNKNTIKPILAVGATIAAIRFLGVGPGLGVGAVATFGLMGTAGLATIATGAFGVLGFIGRSVGIAIATPVIITLLVIPPLVAFIMLVINNSAYVVPPAPLSSSGSEVVTSPYIDIIKTPNPPGPFKNSDLPLTVEYTVEIKAKKGNLSNVVIGYECVVLKKNGSAVCPRSEPEIPTTVENGISPTSSFKFTYKHTYNALSFDDSFVTDTITVNADVVEQVGVTSAGSATIKIGEPPEDCPSIWPTSNGYITQGAYTPASCGRNCSHGTTESIDIGVSNTGVVATHTGTVVLAERNSCYGNRVQIKSNCNGEDFISQYAHLEGISVKNGQLVTMGQNIGLSGNTGSCTTGPHLHYEFRYYPDGKPSFPNNPPFMTKPYVPLNIKRGCKTTAECGVSF